MPDFTAPDKRRLLTTLRRQKADRVPNLEFVLMKRNTEAIIGADRLADVEARYKRLDTPWPPRSESEVHDRSALARYSCYLPPVEYRMLLEKTGQDAVCCTLSWKPKSRKPLSGGAVARGQEGIITNRAELEDLPPAPAVPDMMAALDAYIESFRGTGIGVGILVRSVLCNTYETLGMENFMLTMYDDPGLIEILLDRYCQYSMEIARAASTREVDFLAIDDDICDNSGFLVNPDFIRAEWLPRTRAIMQPFISRDVPVMLHCCGNVERVIPLALDLGISAIHPLQPTCNDIYGYRKRFGQNICLMGNMDLAGVLAWGTPEQVREDTRQHIERLARQGGYIAASSHSITDDVPPENYRAMIETAWSSGRS
jgi:hypothetical protein